MVDECSCDLAPALTSEDGSLLPYLEEEGQHDIDNEYIYTKTGSCIQILSRKFYISHLAYYLVLLLQQRSPVYSPRAGCAGVMADGRETLKE